jgi:hypothetical protein
VEVIEEESKIDSTPSTALIPTASADSISDDSVDIQIDESVSNIEKEEEIKGTDKNVAEDSDEKDMSNTNEEESTDKVEVKVESGEESEDNTEKQDSEQDVEPSGSIDGDSDTTGMQDDGGSGSVSEDDSADESDNGGNDVVVDVPFSTPVGPKSQPESESESDSEGDEENNEKASPTPSVSTAIKVIPAAKTELEQYIDSGSDSDSDATVDGFDSTGGDSNKRRVSFTSNAILGNGSTPVVARKKLRHMGSPLDSLLFKPLPLKSPSHRITTPLFTPGIGNSNTLESRELSLPVTNAQVQKKQKTEVSTSEAIGSSPMMPPASKGENVTETATLTETAGELTSDQRMCERCGRVLNKKTKHPLSACDNYRKRNAAATAAK